MNHCFGSLFLLSDEKKCQTIWHLGEERLRGILLREGLEGAKGKMALWVDRRSLGGGGEGG